MSDPVSTMPALGALLAISLLLVLAPVVLLCYHTHPVVIPE